MSVADLAKRCTLRKTSIDGSKVEWLKIQWIQVRKASPLKLYLKYTIQDDVPFDCVDFKKKERGVDVLRLLKKSYDHRHPMSKEKCEDIRKLLKYVPPVYHGFYHDRISDAVERTSSDAVEILDDMVSESEDTCNGETSKNYRNSKSSPETVTPVMAHSCRTRAQVSMTKKTLSNSIGTDEHVTVTPVTRRAVARRVTVTSMKRKFRERSRQCQPLQ